MPEVREKRHQPMKQLCGIEGQPPVNDRERTVETSARIKGARSLVEGALPRNEGTSSLDEGELPHRQREPPHSEGALPRNEGMPSLDEGEPPHDQGEPALDG